MKEIGYGILAGLGFFVGIPLFLLMWGIEAEVQGAFVILWLLISILFGVAIMFIV